MTKKAMTKPVAIYLRVSTEDQSHDSQKRAVEQWLDSMGWNDRRYFEEKASGTRISRLKLDTMMRQVRKGEIGAIVVYKLDRLGRSLIHLAQLVDELGTHGTALVATSQGIDTSDSNPAGKFQFQVLAAMAEFERSLISERTKAGMAAAKARGSQIGRKVMDISAARLKRLARMIAAGDVPSCREAAGILSCGRNKASQVVKEMVETGGKA